MPNPPWWLTLASGATGTAALGGVFGGIRWLLSRERRMHETSLTEAQVRETAALAEQALADAKLKTQQAERESLLAQGDVLGLLQSYMQSFARQEQDVARLMTKVSALETLVAGRDSTIAGLKTQVNTLQADLRTAAGDRDALQVSLQVEQARSLALDAKLADTAVRIQAMEERITILTAENVTLQDRIAGLP